MGAVADAIASSAKSFGASVRTSSPVERILVKNGKVRGVALVDGTELLADTVVAATHPQITFLRQIDDRELPDDFVSDLRNWQSRSGTVKVNLALSELPSFTANPGHEVQEGPRRCRSPTAASRACSTTRCAPRART
jgi:phytoene dehydrogenase-like protein